MPALPGGRAVNLAFMVSGASAGRVRQATSSWWKASDCHTLWLHGIPALGVPWAGTWKDEWASFFEGVSTFYAVVEPDAGGEVLRGKLGRSPLRDRIRWVSLGEAKDPSGVYLASPREFQTRWQAAVDRSLSWADQEQAEAEARVQEAR